jgi:hypothetical protein
MNAVAVTGVALVGEAVDVASASFRVRPPRLGRMDRQCVLALLAAEAALVDAGIDPTSWPATWRSERVAVAVGTAFGCHATNADYYRGLIEGGPRNASPRLFAYTLPSSPLGEVTIHFGARGPAETVGSGAHAGLDAVARAAARCARGEADVAIAVVLEVEGATLPSLGLRCPGGAVALVIERTAERGRAILVGSGGAFDPDAPHSAAAAATARAVGDAGLAQAPAPLSVEEGVGALPAANALARWLLGPKTAGDPCLAVATDGAGGATALLLRAR